MAEIISRSQIYAYGLWFPSHYDSNFNIWCNMEKKNQKWRCRLHEVVVCYECFILCQWMANLSQVLLHQTLRYRRVFRSRKSKDRQHHSQQKKNKMTNNYIQYTTQTTTDRATKTQKTGGKSDTPEGYTITAPHVTDIVLLMLQTW
jgi:hypothetical protein